MFSPKTFILHPFAFILVFALCLPLPGALAATQSNDGAAKLAAPWLQSNNDARSLALAALTAAPKGPGALGDNVAGLSGGKGWQLGLDHTLGIEGLSQEHGVLGWSNGKTGVGLGFDYLNFGSVDAYSVVGNKLVAGTAFNPYAANASLGASQKWGGVSLGAAAKWASQSLDGSSSASAFAGDLGLLWAGKSGLSLGVAAQNLGGDLDGAKLPAQTKLGLAYQAKPGGHAWLLAADYSLNLAAGDSSANQAAFGTEFWLHPSVALRAGYTLAQRGSLGGTAGLSGGLGIKVSRFTLNYAYSGLGELGAVQVIGGELGW